MLPRPLARTLTKVTLAIKGVSVAKRKFLSWTFAAITATAKSNRFDSPFLVMRDFAFVQSPVVTTVAKLRLPHTHVKIIENTL